MITFPQELYVTVARHTAPLAYFLEYLSDRSPGPISLLCQARWCSLHNGICFRLSADSIAAIPFNLLAFPAAITVSPSPSSLGLTCNCLIWCISISLLSHPSTAHFPLFTTDLYASLLLCWCLLAGSASRWTRTPSWG